MRRLVGTDGEKESKESILSAHLGNDDDDGGDDNNDDDNGDGDG